MEKPRSNLNSICIQGQKIWETTPQKPTLGQFIAMSVHFTSTWTILPLNYPEQLHQALGEGVLKPWPIPTIVESHFPRFQDTESLIWKRTFLHAPTSLAQYESYVHKLRISLI